MRGSPPQQATTGPEDASPSLPVTSCSRLPKCSSNAQANKLAGHHSAPDLDLGDCRLQLSEQAVQFVDLPGPDLASVMAEMDGLDPFVVLLGTDLAELVGQQRGLPGQAVKRHVATGRQDDEVRARAEVPDQPGDRPRPEREEQRALPRTSAPGRLAGALWEPAVAADPARNPCSEGVGSLGCPPGTRTGPSAEQMRPPWARRRRRRYIQALLDAELADQSA